MASSYTLILSRGTYVVDTTDGESILEALSNRKPVVTVDVDMLGDGFVRENVRLATSHVIAVIPNVADDKALDEIPYAPNVTLLRALR
jgi:hypothetical protein